MYKTKIDNLDLKQIADSGQCFRWKNTGEKEYTVVAFDMARRIKPVSYTHLDVYKRQEHW